MSDRNDEILALYALGVPVKLLSKQYGMKASAIRKLASGSSVKRPAPSEKALLARVARLERIRRHVEDNPSVPLFVTVEKAA